MLLLVAVVVLPQALRRHHNADSLGTPKQWGDNVIDQKFALGETVAKGTQHMAGSNDHPLSGVGCSPKIECPSIKRWIGFVGANVTKWGDKFERYLDSLHPDYLCAMFAETHQAESQSQET